MWIEKKPLPPPPHYCSSHIPQERVGGGSIWQCDECGTKWMYDSYYESWEYFPEPKEPFKWWWKR